MESKINQKENNVVKLGVNFSAEEFKASMDKAYKKNAKRFSVPGFRAGKAPMSVALRYYGEGVLYEDAIDFLLNEQYGALIKEHQLEPVSSPEPEILSIGMNKGVELVLNITVKPEVKLGKYKGVEATQEEVNVDDSVVNTELERIRKRNARMVSVDDRAAQLGDTVNINYQGLLEGVPFEGGTAENHDLVLGSNSFIPGFEEQLVGKEVDGDYDLDLSFPEEYHSEELKGKAVVFKVHVNGISYEELPELDDDFAMDVSEFDSLEEYKESLKKEAVEKAELQVKNQFEHYAVDAAVDNAEVDIPTVMIDNAVNNTVQRQNSQMQQSGFSLEQYLGFTGQTMEQFREQVRPQAERQVKTSLVLEAIGNVENFDMDDAEFEAELQKLASSYNMTVDKMKENGMELDSMRDYLKDNVVIQKTIDFIRDNAIPVPAVKEEVKTDDNTASEEESK